MRLGLLMCGRVAPAAQRAGGDYPELFATFFAQHDITLQQIDLDQGRLLSLIHISEPTRLLSISYAVFCLKKKKTAYT